MNDLIKLAREKHITPDQFREAYEAYDRSAWCETTKPDKVTWVVYPGQLAHLSIIIYSDGDGQVDLAPKAAIRWAEGLIEAARKLL